MTDATAVPTPTDSALPRNTGHANGRPRPATPTEPAARIERKSSPLLRSLALFASLRLTVTLLFFTLGLIFFGTLAQTRSGIWQVMAEYFRSFYVAVPLDLLVPRGFGADGGVPGVLPWPGGATLGVLLLVNLCAAHAVRYKVVAQGRRLALGSLVTLFGVGAIAVAFLVPPVANALANHGVVLLFALGSLFFLPLLWGARLLFGRRFGIVLIHAALILLLAGEFVTAFVAEEGQMPIYTGQGLNWVQDIRENELAVMLPTGEANDAERDVWAVSESALRRAFRGDGLIELPGLELMLRVDQYMPNALLFRRSDNTEVPPQATAGWGLDRVYAQPTAPVSGVGEQRVDQAAAVVSLLNPNGQLVERVLVATGLEQPDAPYRPIVQTVETPAGPVELAMRFKRTYLPYTVELAEFRHDLYPGSSVPKNYSSDVTLVGTEGSAQRSALIRMNEPLRYEGKTFFQSSWIAGPIMANGQPMPGADRGTILQVVDNPGWTVPYIAVIVGGLGLLAHFVMSLIAWVEREGAKSSRAGKAEKGSESSATSPRPVLIGTLAAVLVAAALLWPVQRVAPRTPTGMNVADFGAVAVSYAGRFKPWDSVARDTLAAIGGRERVERGDESVHPVAWLLDAVTQPAGRDDRVFRIDLANLKHELGVRDLDRKRFSYNEIAPHRAELVRLIETAEQVDERTRSAFERAVLELGNRLAIYEGVVSLTSPHAVALDGADGQTGAGWVPLPDAVSSGSLPGDAALVGQAIMAYGQGDAAKFNQTTAALRQAQKERFPAVFRKSQIEAEFNAYGPFMRSIMLYVAAGLCVFGSWLVAPRAFRGAALTLLLVALFVHTTGLGVRVYLSGRPPVTNLYGSAVFVGWGVVILGLLLERVTKLGLGYLTASLTGFCTLLVARGLDDGDTMAVLQAVLDTNFWLATHVIMITLGYSAMFVAALIGAAYLLMGAYTGVLRQARDRRALEGVIFGVTCFALLLSFVGTILGGVWADQSWGRFWGWDPKENGALMIVLWAALLIHARLGGMVKGPGVAALAVLGAVITLWSWFGVNMLGVGLHSYGFMDSAVFWMLLAVAVLCAVASVALIPQRRWVSFAKNA